MQNKIALEEHFMVPGVEGYLPDNGFDAALAQAIEARLPDAERWRISSMDEHGIRMQILSLTANGVQAEPDRAKVVAMARRANDWLTEHFIRKHPARFAGFAAVALQDPKEAANEIERAIKTLGFKGVLVNGFTNASTGIGEYYDLPKFLPFWERANDLGVPVYLHPRGTLPSQQLIYEGHHELLGPSWAFGVEPAPHALRRITAGLFDRFPKLTMILGHLGEGLVPMIWRTQNRFNYASFGKKLRKPMARYLPDHFYITTSGNFHTPALKNVIEEMGVDRVMFSVDYPYETNDQAVSWFDSCPIGDEAREKIGRTNAERLFKLDPAPAS